MQVIISELYAVTVHITQKFQLCFDHQIRYNNVKYKYICQTNIINIANSTDNVGNANKNLS